MQGLRYLFQNPVPFRVAKAVVDLLKGVYVQYDEAAAELVFFKDDGG